MRINQTLVGLMERNKTDTVSRDIEHEHISALEEFTCYVKHSFNMICLHVNRINMKIVFSAP